MSESSPQHTVTIHGTVYGLAIGDQAAASIGFTSAQSLPPFMTPPLPPQGVFGRDDMLTKLFDALSLSDDQVTNVPPIALRGMGGIGKTTLAKTLGRLEFIPERFPDGVLWAELGPNPTIRILLDGWGKALGVDLMPERDEIACRDRLRTTLYHRKALLIVDDIWETAHGKYFLVAGPHCRTLLTTRDLVVAQNIATREHTLFVGVLNPDASLALLQKHAPETVTADIQSARRLCEQLEYLPLALTLAGRLLANESDIPSRMKRLMGELIERREVRLKLLQFEGRLGLDEDQLVSLEAVLGISIERMSKIDQERFAMLTVFGGEPLTWEIKAVSYVWDCSIEEAEATTLRFIQRGLIEPKGGRYWMHALLADYAAEMMKKME